MASTSIKSSILSHPFLADTNDAMKQLSHITKIVENLIIKPPTIISVFLESIGKEDDKIAISNINGEFTTSNTTPQKNCDSDSSKNTTPSKDFKSFDNV